MGEILEKTCETDLRKKLKLTDLRLLPAEQAGNGSVMVYGCEFRPGLTGGGIPIHWFPLWDSTGDVYERKPMSKGKLKTFMAKPGEIERTWYVVDATDQVLGRLATKIATVLMGKHKPTYTPHVDTGDFVVVTNAHKIRVTGKKADTMVYPRYSYYPGGYKEIPYKRVMERHPDRIIREAVRRMLPKNALGRRMLKKLKVYASAGHPHSAQQPSTMVL